MWIITRVSKHAAGGEVLVSIEEKPAASKALPRRPTLKKQQ
jgi:hypothetical protein